MQYGHFQDDALEYVITNPCTPVKWINYVGTLDFGGFVDHTGGAMICRGDPATNRITRYISVQPAGDFRGTSLYLRVRRDGTWKVTSPFFVPCLEPLDEYACHVGLGYSRILSRKEGVRTEATFFVPEQEHRLIVDIRVTNLGAAPVEVDVVPVAEYSHFDALKQLTNADWVPQTMQSRALQPGDGHTLLLQHAFMMRDTRVNFMASSLPASSYETDRRLFLGRNEYGTWTRPAGLEETELGGHEALRGDNIGALLHHLGRLDPGEQRRLVVQIGQANGIDAAAESVRAFRDPTRVDEAFSRLAQAWKTRLGALQVETPDVSTNRMLNIHNPRQCAVTFSWSRYLSLYQTGYGARGIGFRDSSQDAMGVASSAHGETKSLLRSLLGAQTREGFAMHQYNPATLQASMGDAMERDDRPHWYSDDHLWSVLAVSEYIKETGDFAFLEESIPFFETDREGRRRESATVAEHLRRGIEFTRRNTGAHGLPLLGFADWNDTVNLPAGAESLFTANLYGKALTELMALERRRGRHAEADGLEGYYRAMKESFLAHAWDGEWWIRYFDHDGSPLGSRANSECRIYINAQSWPVLSGFAPADRARTALDSVHRLLATRNGIKISAPAFNGFDPRKGGITTYPPGAKENGGIFLHTNPWVIIAETMLGNGDRAYEYYRRVDPGLKNEMIDEYECEPYAYAQNILGDEHPLFGLARNSWLSGTASWAYQAATKHILGLRPTLEGLLIDPCVPSSWNGFHAARRFRGVLYDLVVRNPSHVCKGVASISVDGTRRETSVLPLFAEGETHDVEVTLG